MKKIVFVGCLLLVIALKAQHIPINAQYLYHGLLVNPAITGSHNDLIVSSSYRHQFLGNKFGPKTMLLSIHTPLKREDLAVGVQLYRDHNSVLTRNGIALYGAYRIPMFEGHLTFGLKFGFYNNQLNYGELEIIDANDPQFMAGFNGNLVNTGFGTYFRNNKLYLGLSIPQMQNGISNNQSKNVWNYNFMAGYCLALNNRFELLPNLLLRKIGEGKVQPDATLLLRYHKRLDIGLIARSFRSYGISVDLQFTPQLQIGYSVDTGLTKLSVLNPYGNHELGLIYEFKKVVNATDTKFF
jgi:type IX secretion system PorP/SprF family membrane protein